MDKTIMDIDAPMLAQLLEEAEQAHSEHEKEMEGELHDEHWSAWYANYIVERLQESNE